MERAKCTHELENRVERDRSEQRKKPSEPGTLTSCRAQRDEQVRSAKESERASGTHKLESAG
jgi:hypothetical protein